MIPRRHEDLGLRRRARIRRIRIVGCDTAPVHSLKFVEQFLGAGLVVFWKVILFTCEEDS